MGYTHKRVIVSRNSRKFKSIGVFSQLIRKAEKRKMSAENFHIYALLQSTIMRLRHDDSLYTMKSLKLDSSKQVETNKAMECSDNSACSGQLDHDLGLDEFFLKLKYVRTKSWRCYILEMVDCSFPLVEYDVIALQRFFDASWSRFCGPCGCP